MKKIRNKVLQQIANFIVNKLSKTTNKICFNLLFTLGISYNSYCIRKFNLYLE